jgi:hypothetical protein
MSFRRIKMRLPFTHTMFSPEGEVAVNLLKSQVRDLFFAAL